MEMVACLPAIGAFCLFYGYDWCVVRRPAAIFLRWGFGAGCGLVFLATFLALTACLPLRQGMEKGFGWGAAALLLGGLTAHSLFFALPKGTYTDPAAPRPVYDRKMYALCRHPGFLWFAGFYFCLGGLLGPKSWPCFGSLCALDFVYILLQDRWTFPLTFEGYGEYRRRVPFLVPTPHSFARCLRQYANRKD